ncbi:MAG TPA: enoyl-CoA hydratase [Jatrophihabitans sp.]|nr:enoyl-CoA hydratase [Jatrophihabitans sp.]
MITAEHAGGVTVLTIDRHERRNAVDLDHCRQLQAAVQQAPGRAVVLTGAGSAFCAGADLTGVYGAEFRHALYDLLACLADRPVPVIAAINGAAIGAGVQLALACDVRVAVDAARFAIPTARNGLAVDPWTVRRIAELAGGGTARGLLIGCETYSADFALARGLIDRIGTVEQALDWARELAELAPLTHRYNKLALAGIDPDGPSPAAVAAAFEACWNSADRAEAEQARREGRKPHFTGR